LEIGKKQMTYTDDDLLPLSALQHYLFCPRQCALIHVERLWFENKFTAEGKVMHERVDKGGDRDRGSVRIEYGLRLVCRELGLVGQADVVEFHSRIEKPVYGFLIRWSINGADPRKTTVTRFSCAPRGCVWKRCTRWKSLKALCFTAKHGGGRRFHSAGN
jgi:hypothetical protein